MFQMSKGTPYTHLGLLRSTGGRLQALPPVAAVLLGEEAPLVKPAAPGLPLLRKMCTVMEQRRNRMRCVPR